jgi:hypothetical protein
MTLTQRAEGGGEAGGSPRTSNSSASDDFTRHHHLPDLHDKTLIEEARSLINKQRAQ